MTPRSDTRHSDAGPVALFPGSFNPFTRGHLSIAERALKFCGKLVIAVGYNMAKHTAEDVEPRLKDIRRVFAGNPRVEVIAYKGLTAELAQQLNADFIIRGIRGNADFDYEMLNADVNRDLSGIETIFLPALPELRQVSSSVVRELAAYGKVPPGYLP